MFMCVRTRLLLRTMGLASSHLLPSGTVVLIMFSHGCISTRRRSRARHIVVTVVSVYFFWRGTTTLILRSSHTTQQNQHYSKFHNIHGKELRAEAFYDHVTCSKRSSLKSMCGPELSKLFPLFLLCYRRMCTSTLTFTVSNQNTVC